MSNQPRRAVLVISEIGDPVERENAQPFFSVAECARGGRLGVL